MTHPTDPTEITRVILRLYDPANDDKTVAEFRAEIASPVPTSLPSTSEEIAAMESTEGPVEPVPGLQDTTLADVLDMEIVCGHTIAYVTTADQRERMKQRITALVAPLLAAERARAEQAEAKLAWQSLDTIPAGDSKFYCLVLEQFDNGGQWVSEGILHRETGRWWEPNTKHGEEYGELFPVKWMPMPPVPSTSEAGQ